jgi:hypothetical protein
VQVTVRICGAAVGNNLCVEIGDAGDALRGFD